MLLAPGDGEIVNGLARNRWVLATVGAAKISLFMSGILSKVSKRYCNGLLVTGDGVVEAKFDEWESVKGDPDASWGINSTIGLISPSDFSSLSPEKSKHCKSEGVNNSEVRSDGFFSNGARLVFSMCLIWQIRKNLIVITWDPLSKPEALQHEWLLNFYRGKIKNWLIDWLIDQGSIRVNRASRSQSKNSFLCEGAQSWLWASE